MKASVIVEPDPTLNRLTGDIIGEAIEVHRVLGPGLLEPLYQRAVCIELTARAIPFVSQPRIALAYKGQPIGAGRLDLLVANAVVVELKAVEALNAVHKAQVLSYLRTTGYPVGLLINFNVPVLKDGIQRFVMTPK